MCSYYGMARRPLPEVPYVVGCHDCFTSLGRFDAAILSPEVLEPVEVYAGGVVGGVRTVEGRRGECCKEPELISDCVTDMLWEGAWGDLAGCVGKPVEHMGCAPAVARYVRLRCVPI